MQIKFRIRNVEAVQSFLRAIPRGAVKVALEAFTDYIIGDESHGLRHAEPYKFVKRKSAYGFTGAKFENGKPVPAGYFSKEQFRYVAWKTKGFTQNMGSASNRTGESTAAWKAVPRNDGYRFTIQNNTAGGYWTRHDKKQARQLGKVGWRKIMTVLADNYKGGIRHAVAAVKAYLDKKG